MPAEPANGLYLADLSIRNFRGIDRLSIRRLGRVTLLGGRNGAGKTTVLEAVRTYAARGDRNTLNALLDQREEYVAGFDEAHDAAASPNCVRDGFLVMDEAENGIHHSVQRGFWRMVLRAAHQYNVQVLATTHSSNCVAGFARAAIECDDALGVYVRLERDGDRVRAVEYTEEELETVADQGIEVR